MKCRRFTIDFFVAIVSCVANLYSYYQMPQYSTIEDGFSVGLSAYTHMVVILDTR